MISFNLDSSLEPQSVSGLSYAIFNRHSFAPTFRTGIYASRGPTRLTLRPCRIPPVRVPTAPRVGFYEIVIGNVP